MSQPQIPICNGGPETFGRTDGHYQWVGHVMAIGCEDELVGTTTTGHQEQFNRAYKTAQKDMQQQAHKAGATVVCNMQVGYTNRTRGSNGPLTSCTITGDAFRFVPSEVST